MPQDLMTWVAGFSVAGFIYLLYRNWIMSHAIQTLWETFKSETERMESDHHLEKALNDTLIGSFIETIERFDERLNIIEKGMDIVEEQSGETNE
jgi:hypothetical protein